MAVKDPPEAAAEPPAPPAAPPAAAPPRPAGPGGAPLWVVPVYVLGMLLVFFGERVLAVVETGHWPVTGLGLALAVVATIARFKPLPSTTEERRAIERMLAGLSVVGLLAVLVYFATTDAGLEKLGLASAETATRDRFVGALRVLWMVLAAGSLTPMMFAEAALLPMRRAEQVERRRVHAAAAAGFAVAMAASYGSLFVYAAHGLELKADYSYFKTSRPSDSTKKIAQSLTEPIKVTAFFPAVNEIRSEVESYLRELAQGIPNLQIEVQDRLMLPKLAKELHATQDGVIILSKGKVNERLIIGAEPKSAKPKLKTLDRDFQEQLLKLVRSRRTAYLTVGHGEVTDTPRGNAATEGRTGKIVRTLLQKQNYVVKDLGLGQGLGHDVPDDADLVLALGPSNPLAPEEIDSLRRFAERGGKLFIAFDPDAISGENTGTVNAAALEAEPDPAEAVAPKPAESAKPAASAKPPASARPTGSAKPAGSARPSASARPAPKPAGSAKPPGSAKAAGSAAPPAPKKPEPAKTDAPAVPAAPAGGWEALAAVAGLTYSPVVLAHEQQHLRRRFNMSDRTMLATNRFSSHAAVSTLSRNSSRAAVVVFGSGSLDRASGTTAKVNFAVRSLAGTFADANRNYRLDSGAEKQQVYNVAAAVSEPAKNAKPKAPEPPKDDKKKDDKKKDDKKGAAPPDEMRAFVIADSDAVSDVVLSNVVANQVLFLDAVRWLAGEESFAGEVNAEEDVRIEHTKAKDVVWFYSTIIGIPAVVLGVGLVMARRRRPRSAK